uniref:Uncharacterized protein n=1 Tax=Anguilla anguilla TaxID=7936 RepID=A0A0E9T9I9_ANGAN
MRIPKHCARLTAPPPLCLHAG